jgi:hypothetical protein
MPVIESIVWFTLIIGFISLLMAALAIVTVIDEARRRLTLARIIRECQAEMKLLAGIEK